MKKISTFLRGTHDNNTLVSEPVIVLELNGVTLLVGVSDFDFVVFGLVVAGTGEEGNESAVGFDEVCVVDNDKDSVSCGDEAHSHDD